MVTYSYLKNEIVIRTTNIFRSAETRRHRRRDKNGNDECGEGSRRDRTHSRYKHPSQYMGLNAKSTKKVLYTIIISKLYDQVNITSYNLSIN